MRAAFAAAALLLAALLPPLAGAQAAAPCASNLDAAAQGDGSIHLQWTPAPGAARQLLHRAESPTGSFSLLVTLDGTTTGFHDADTRPGVVYRYAVTTGDATPASSCPEASARAVAYLHGLVTALGIAFVAATGYALVRARA